MGSGLFVFRLEDGDDADQRYESSLDKRNMRYAIISNINGNLEALTACLAHIDRQSIDRIICLGDMVGECTDPGPCVELIRNRAYATVAGNHDWNATGKRSLRLFGPSAKQVALRNRDHLSDEQKKWLDQLPLVGTSHGFAVTHASFHEPGTSWYIRTDTEAELCLAALTKLGHRLGFTAHSVPAPAVITDRRVVYAKTPDVAIDPNQATVICPGAIGQPHDDDPRATYAIFDTECSRVHWYRVAYDIASAAGKIRAAGLPDFMAERLFVGR